jgi:hypothetical protein
LALISITTPIADEYPRLTPMADTAPEHQEAPRNRLVDTRSPESHKKESTEDSPSTPEPSFSITELQAVFGSMLLTTKSTNTKSNIPYTTYRGCPDTPLKPSPPKWTGAFKLFDFPRELRDLIYYHAVYRPKGLHHTAHVSRDWQFRYNKDKSEDISKFCPLLPPLIRIPRSRT